MLPGRYCKQMSPGFVVNKCLFCVHFRFVEEDTCYEEEEDTCYEDCQELHRGLKPFQGSEYPGYDPSEPPTSPETGVTKFHKVLCARTRPRTITKFHKVFQMNYSSLYCLSYDVYRRCSSKQ